MGHGPEGLLHIIRHWQKRFVTYYFNTIRIDLMYCTTAVINSTLCYVSIKYEYEKIYTLNGVFEGSTEAFVPSLPLTVKYLLAVYVLEDGENTFIIVKKLYTSFLPSEGFTRMIYSYESYR